MKIAVAGAGLSGLSLCHALQEKLDLAGKSASITLFESEARTGGKVQTIKEDGYLVEWGPNGFLNNKPDTLELCHKLGIAKLLLPSNDAARKRYIYAGGRLHRLPESPPAFIGSKLISWPGKFRLMAEPFVPKIKSGVDETLADFARRRLGPEALERLIGPMASGVFGGDPETMSLRSCFPRIYELERDYGGLFKAMLKLMMKKRREQPAAQKAGPAGPGGVLTSFDGGLEVLTRALGKAFKGEVRLGQPVLKVEKAADGKGFVIHAGGSHDVFTADVFISASPAYAAADFLSPIDPNIPEVLEQIKYAPMAVVCMGTELENIGVPLDGFGFLVGMREGRRLLGSLWDSSIFPGRAPEGFGSLRSMAGGARDLATPALPDAELAEVVRKELSDIMGLTGVPKFLKVFKHEKAIPQYTVGHGDRVARLDAIEARHQGLLFAGNSFRGVGINDCVREAYNVADKAMLLI